MRAAVVDRDVAQRHDPCRSRCRPRPPTTCAPNGNDATRLLEVVLDEQRLAAARSALVASSAHVERRRRHAGDAEPAVVGDHDVVGRASSSSAASSLRLVAQRGATPRAPRCRRAAANASRRCRHHAARARCRTARSVMLSIGMPSSAATICEYAVAWPWPCADVPAFTVAVPSSCTSTVGELAPGAAGGDLDVHRRCRCRAA